MIEFLEFVGTIVCTVICTCIVLYGVVLWYLKDMWR